MTLACKNYYPDTEVFGRYDAMWQEYRLKPAVGVNLNLPIYRGRLDSAVREARFTASQRRAEYEQLVLDIQYDVTTAFEQVEESSGVLQLYSECIVPAAEQNVAAARLTMMSISRVSLTSPPPNAGWSRSEKNAKRR